MFTGVSKIVPALALLAVTVQTIPALADDYGTNTPYNNGYSNANTYAPPGNFNGACPPNYQRGRVSFVPAGLMFPVALTTSISTDVARPGDTVSANLSDSINLGDSVIPAGATVLGTVTEAKSGGFLGRSGMLTVKFNRLRLPSGQEVPMSAHIVGGIGKYTQIGNGSDTFKGETWKNKVGQTALRGGVGAGAGAALGTAIGAIAGQHGTRGQAIGRGAWSGAAIGGGLGVADSLLLRKGRNVTITSGQQMQLQLDAPIQVSAMQMGAF